MPINFKGANIGVGEISDFNNGDSIPMPSKIGLDQDLNTYTLTCWMPNCDDLKALNAGRPIYLKLLTICDIPPMCIFTMDENDKPNL